MVEIKKSYEHYSLNNPLEFDSTSTTKGYVKDILEIEPCPNCSKDMIAGKCSDSKICGYGHGQDYLDKKEEEREKKSLNMMGNGKKYELITIGGKKFNYFDFYGRIKEGSANLEVEIDGEVYKFNVEYEIKKTDFNTTIENIRFIGSVEIQSKNKKGKIIRKTHYFKYNDLKKYAFGVLADIRFNNFLIST